MIQIDVNSQMFKENEDETIIIVDSKGEGHLVNKKSLDNIGMINKYDNPEKDDQKKPSFELYDDWTVTNSGTNDKRTDSTADCIVNKPFTETYEGDFSLNRTKQAEK